LDGKEVGMPVIKISGSQGLFLPALIAGRKGVTKTGGKNEKL